ncbi:MAG TPA: HEAT repeat domain-containing protein [Gaiellaceae bacterium]|nr:HEAT repeat domain-containing protein [Gaiellaceae bacterium]
MTPEERADEEELRAALRAAGIRDDDFGLFAARDIPEAGIRAPRFDFEAAAPVLVYWLPRVKTALVKERIVRSLTGERAATPLALEPLVAEFRRADDDGLKWAIGNALATLADDSIADKLVELAQDRRHGSSREMLMDALARTKDERALDALVELVDDDDIAGHAISALRRLGPKSSLPYLERARPSLERQATDGETPLARRQASAALARLS